MARRVPPSAQQRRAAARGGCAGAGAGTGARTTGARTTGARARHDGVARVARVRPRSARSGAGLPHASRCRVELSRAARSIAARTRHGTRMVHGRFFACVCVREFSGVSARGAAGLVSVCPVVARGKGGLRRSVPALRHGRILVVVGRPAAQILRCAPACLSQSRFDLLRSNTIDADRS